MTASTDGVFTGLRWPTPGYFDQLAHVTTDRALPRMGARRTDGLSLGVRIKDTVGSRIITVDDPWLEVREQGYLSDTSRIARWTASNDLLTLEQQAFVIPDQDVLVVRLTVTPHVDFNGLDAVLLMHPAPNARRFEAFPVADWWLDRDENQFAAIRDDGAEALVTLAPVPAFHDEALRRLRALKDTASGRDMLASVEDLSAVAMAVAVDQPAQFQVGASDDGTGTLRPRDAFSDAEDGSLEGNRAVLGDATLAWLVPLHGSVASEVTFFIALAETPLRALGVLSGARSTPLAALIDDAERSAQAVTETAALPDTTESHAHSAALRALISLEMLSARDSPSVVTSAATQPSWGVDRAVDSAIVDVALANCGRLSRAVEHRIWWAGLQRVAPDGLGAAGTWGGAYDPEGLLASLVTSPLDGTAMQLWAHTHVVERALTTVEVADPTRARRETAASLDAAVGALLACVSTEGDRPCPAQEWDRVGDRQTDWQLATALAALNRALPFLRNDDVRSAAESLRDRYRAAAETRLIGMPLHALAFALGDGEVLRDDGEARSAAIRMAIMRARDHAGDDGFLLPFSLWQLLVATRGEDALRPELDALVDAFVGQALSPFGHAGMQIVDGGTNIGGTPAAPAEAALMLALLERHGRRPPPSLPVPELPRCACRSTDPDAPTGLLLVVTLALTRRVVRGARRTKKLPGLAASR